MPRQSKTKVRLYCGRTPKNDTFVFSCAKTCKSDRTPHLSMAQDYIRSIDEGSYALCMYLYIHMWVHIYIYRYIVIDVGSTDSRTIPQEPVKTLLQNDKRSAFWTAIPMFLTGVTG